jgi:hypothetical protein
MNDRSLVMVMTQGIGSHLTNDEKRAHLTDLRRELRSVLDAYTYRTHVELRMKPPGVGRFVVAMNGLAAVLLQGALIRKVQFWSLTPAKKEKCIS